MFKKQFLVIVNTDSSVRDYILVTYPLIKNNNFITQDNNDVKCTIFNVKPVQTFSPYCFKCLNLNGSSKIPDVLVVQEQRTYFNKALNYSYDRQEYNCKCVTRDTNLTSNSTDQPNGLLINVNVFSVELDSHVISCMVSELQFSSTYLKRFILTCHRTFFKRLKFTSTNIPVFVMTLKYPLQKIDYSWNEKIQTLILKHVCLQENMAWLSTLGGGYSALGDYFVQHAEVAAMISQKQLRVSQQMADPICAAKCRVYFAQSLMQRGYLKEACRIVRAQFEYAKSLGEQDDRLKWMCKGVWSHLKHLHHKARLKRSPVWTSL